MFEFLTGLSFEHEQVRAQILNMNLPPLNEVYAHIHKEEGKRGVMNPSSSVEKLTFISSSSRGDVGVLLLVVVVDVLVPWMIAIALSVSIVVGPGILRTNVGIYIDIHKIFLHVSTSEGDRTQLA